MRYKSAKENILATAAILFYDKGYRGTSLEDIAVRCDVTRPAIIYHFESKDALGVAVTDVYESRQAESFRNIIRKRFPDIDELTILAARTIWTPGFMKADANAARFYEEFLSVSKHFKEIGNTQASHYLKPEIDGPDSLEDRVKMLAAIYAGRGLLDCYLDGTLECGSEEFSRHFFMNYFAPFIRGGEEIERLYDAAKTVLNSVEIRILPFFKIH
jgi:AcrR family transcriptional regulator